MKFSVIISAFCFLLIVQNIYCQGGMQQKWMVTTSAGIEKHDKRLFDYPEKEMLLEMQPEKWGTYHFGINVSRRIRQQNNFYGFLGLGLGYENATFLRPFDHKYFYPISYDYLLYQNRYNKITTSLSLSTIYEIGNHWIFSVDMVSSFLLFRKINNTNAEGTSRFPYTKGTLKLDDIHLNLGVNYRVGNFLIGLKGRALNFQKIDKIIFNYYLKDPRTDQRWEWHNPLRFDFAIGYMW